MQTCVTRFDSCKAGFDGDGLYIPLKVLDGPHEHRSIDGELTRNEARTRVWHARSYDVVQLLGRSNETPIEEAARETYRQLLGMLDERRRLLRVWNFIPRVLEEENDIERYRSFNVGRYEAMHAHGVTTLPAATGIGSMHGPLIVEALITENPTTALQNPLQTPAQNYSWRYGPRPPLFARGTFHHVESPELYISGTASVRGEETVHPWKSAEQAETTVENIRTLLGAKNMCDHGIDHSGFDLEDLEDIRVFVKRTTDMEVIRPIVEAHFGTRKQISYLLDDICRPSLLVEIEGVARKA